MTAFLLPDTAAQWIRDWATAHRHTVAVIVVLTVGLGALVIEQSL